jgi:hypothetical protein
MPLYLTYDNQALADGAGAQIQRIISIYLIAKQYNVNYIHSGLAKMTYQGAKCLEENKSDPDQMFGYNKLIDLSSDPAPAQFDVAGKVFDISPQLIEEYRDKPQNTLFIIQFAGTMIDQNPHLLLAAQQLLPFSWTIRPSLQGRPIQVAVHVRRGELFVVDSERMLPNSYYVDCIKAISSLFQKYSLPFEIHLHTEVLTKPTLITPSHHGICDRVKSSKLVSPEDSHMEDFEGLPNLVLRINEHPMTTLKALTTSDVLIASRSSFSYIAAIMKKGGVVFFHPFWHSLAPGWIPTNSGQDILAAEETLFKKLLA